MSKRSPLRRVVVYGGALLLALFWFAPFALVFIGSVLPEINLLSFPPHWFADPPNLQTYGYIFTGKVPESFEQRDGILATRQSNSDTITLADHVEAMNRLTNLAQQCLLEIQIIVYRETFPCLEPLRAIGVVLAPPPARRRFSGTSSRRTKARLPKSR